MDLTAAVMHGEHALRGFTNANVCGRLCSETAERKNPRRNSQRTGRLLKLLHAHGLIARIPRSRRVTRDGWATMSTILLHHHDYYPATRAAQAA